MLGFGLFLISSCVVVVFGLLVIAMGDEGLPF